MVKFYLVPFLFFASNTIPVVIAKDSSKYTGVISGICGVAVGLVVGEGVVEVEGEVGAGVDDGVGVGEGVGAGAAAKFAFIVPGPFMFAVVDVDAALRRAMAPVLLDQPENK